MLGESKPFVRNIFTLNTCSHIVGSQVLSFHGEAELLERWRDFVAEVYPDVIIGYNISNFDFPYLMDRAKALKANNFPLLGRMIREQKEDVHHSVITELQSGTPESKRRLAVYCLKDAYLPERLLDKLMCFTNYTEMSTIDRLNLIKDIDYIQCPNNDFFVKSSQRKGLLPAILEDLIGARKHAKADLKKKTDPFKRAVLGGRQLALKVFTVRSIVITSFIDLLTDYRELYV
ncbi:hypothetical protein A0H81_13824 [Grifola frondosa]|uniref:DNA polymerase delta catalytic subunit n=1 Tax=Grifola frondosa TaxID=5627 RepID=A0A1C7LQ88_GRIFR|nr:hypothetical protein A0H81_13824 [Grifola frondosa]